MSVYVLDSFAILAKYWHEPGQIHVDELISARENDCRMTVVNLGEVYYRIAREEGTPAANRAAIWLETLPIQYVEADLALAMEAAQIKAQHALSYADCFAGALAQQTGGAVVTGDREFAKLEAAGLLSVEWIPFRPRGRSR